MPCLNRRATGLLDYDLIPPISQQEILTLTYTRYKLKIRMAKKKLPPDILDFFRKEGSRGGKVGGKIGGKRSLETMTPEERTARAKRAGLKSAEARSKKALEKNSTKKGK